mgnify:CR=1 FL=1
MKREKHPSWKGGRNTDGRGYIHILKPEHPNADSRGYVLEHRSVAEQAIGRQLRDDEVVHHLNGIKGDNRPENLRVMRTGAHRHWIPILQERIRFLEGELKKCQQSAMELDC